MMKRKLCFLIIAVMCISLVACTSSTKDVLTSGDVTIEGVYVNDGYRDSDGSSRRALYLFFNLNPTQNYNVDSKMDIIIDEINTYSAETLKGNLLEYAPNYYYSTWLEDVYVGEPMKLAATFLVPEADLIAGKKITIQDDDLFGIEKIVVYTDSIIHVTSDEEVCTAVDSEGCAKIKKGYEMATEERVAEVKEKINKKYWEAYVNPTTYRIEFYENKFVLKTPLGENSGEYSIRNDYIFCTYQSNGVTIKIPYELHPEGVKMFLDRAFSR